MVDVDGQDLQEPLLARRRYGIGSMIGVRPSIRSVRETSICEKIEDALVGVLLRSHKYKTENVSIQSICDPQKNSLFQSMRASRVVEDCDASVIVRFFRDMHTHSP